jgi:hypothetical protein
MQNTEKKSEVAAGAVSHEVAPLLPLKEAVLKALREANVATVTVSYCGSGDDGGIDTTDARDHEDFPVNLETINVVYADDDGENQEMNLKTACADLCDAAIDDNNHSGYEKESGGRGDFTIDVDSGKMMLCHAENFTDSQEEVTKIPARDSKKDAKLTSLASTMKKAGVEKIVVSYAGAGDSGSIENVGFFDADSKAMKIDLKISGYPSIKPRRVAGQWIDESVVEEKDAQDAARDIVYDKLDIHHRAWGDGDGCSGYVEINANGSMRITHFNNIEKSNETTYVIRDADEESAATARPPM